MSANIEIELLELECANKDIIRHYLIEPRAISCGHDMCNSCINDKMDNNKVWCDICDAEADCFKCSNESIILNKLINKCLPDLLTTIQLNCIDLLKEAIKNYNDKKQSIEAKFQFVKEQIEIKAQSIKIEIDNLCNLIFDDLKNKKNEFLSEINSHYIQLDEYKRNNDELEYITDGAKMSIDLLRDYQSLLFNLDPLNEALKTYAAEVEFSPSKSIDMSIFGELSYDNCNFLKADSLEVEEVSSISMKVHDICHLNVANLLLADHANGTLSVCDRNFKLIKKIENIASMLFQPYSVACDGLRNRIYISDRVGDRIIMTDYDFNVVATVGSNGSNIDEFDKIAGICLSDDLCDLYVCDLNNNRIKMYKKDLTFKSSFELEFEPWYIKVIKNTACIREFDEANLYFYSLPSFNQRYRYEGHNGFICIQENYFYELYEPNKTIYCYNKDGTFKSEHKLQSNYDFDAIYFHGTFIFPDNKQNLIYKNKLLSYL